MDEIKKELLLKVADLHEIPSGAFNLRENGVGVIRKSTEHIIITPKTDKSGIDIDIKSNTRNEAVHIPVIVTKTGLKDIVYNDFFVGDNCDVLIVAGCGIHNDGSFSGHNGIHAFHIGKNSKVRYVEKHYANGTGKEKILNPITKVNLGVNSEMIMETYQLGGVTYADRKTSAVLKDNSRFEVQEKILTDGNQEAKTNFKVKLNGKNSRCEVVSRSVAKNNSSQVFKSEVTGNNDCYGRVECDGIIIDNAVINSIPSIFAKNVNASLTHEATIGKIAGDELIKLMTLGLTTQEAEDLIIKGFLS